MKDLDRQKVPVLNEDDSPQNGDDLGAAEAFSLGRGLPERDLKREVDENDHDRNERFKRHFDNIGIAALYAAASALAVSGVVWFWHIITPWHFLNADQLSHLQNLLTGGVLVSVGTTYLKKRLG